MNHLYCHVGEDDPCDVEYKKLFPATSKRTMQRDFNTLYNVGYELLYKRAWRLPPDEREGLYYNDMELIAPEPSIGHYYIELLPFSY